MSARAGHALEMARLVREASPRPFWRKREHKLTLLLAYAVQDLVLECEGLETRLDLLAAKLPLDERRAEHIGSAPDALL